MAKNNKNETVVAESFTKEDFQQLSKKHLEEKQSLLDRIADLEKRNESKDKEIETMNAMAEKNNTATTISEEKKVLAKEGKKIHHNNTVLIEIVKDGKYFKKGQTSKVHATIAKGYVDSGIAKIVETKK